MPDLTIWLIVGVLFILAFIIFIAQGLVTHIKAHEIGLVLRQGAATNRILGPGQYFLKPFVETVIKYPRRELTYMVVENELYERVKNNKEVDFVGHALDITTADNTTANILYTIRFRILSNSEGVRLIHERFGRSGLKGVVRDESRHIVRLVLNERNYTAADLLGPSRAEVERDISTRLQERLAENGLEMTHFGLREPDLGELGQKLREQMRTREELKLEQEISKIEEERYRRAEQKAESEAKIEAARIKSQAEAAALAEKIKIESQAEVERIQRVKAAQAETEVAKLISEKQVIEAQAQAEISKINAEAIAHARVIQAKAEGQFNKHLGDSLSDAVIKWHQSQSQRDAALRWDGKLPMLSGQNPFPFINLSSFVETQREEENKDK